MKAAIKPSREDITRAAYSSMSANKVARAYLFGLYARGDAAAGSDVDIAVDMEPGANSSKLI